MGRRSAVADARRGSRGPVIAAVVTVLVLAGVVIAGTTWSHDSSGPSPAGGTATAAPIAVTQVPATYPVTLRAGVIELGRSSAKHTLDIYEDALCPACKQLETIDGPKIAQSLQAGKLKVHYHMVNLLESRSDPPGYSSLGGNAMMCAAEHGGFPSVHASLYNAQPEEGGTAYTAGQLVALGQAVGAGPGYADCVTRNAHAGEISATYARAQKDPALVEREGGQTSFATPTLVLDAKKVDANSSSLDSVLG